MTVAALLLIAGGASMAGAADAPPPHAGSQVERDDGSARLAAQAIDADHPAKAAGILETLVAPRHHMLTISPDWHRDLARAYAALGLITGPRDNIGSLWPGRPATKARPAKSLLRLLS